MGIRIFFPAFIVLCLRFRSGCLLFVFAVTLIVAGVLGCFLIIAILVYQGLSLSLSPLFLSPFKSFKYVGGWVGVAAESRGREASTFVISIQNSKSLSKDEYARQTRESHPHFCTHMIKKDVIWYHVSSPLPPAPTVEHKT